MIYPNKNIRIQDSIIYKMLSILEKRNESEIKISELFKQTISKFQNADEFIYSLDVLYVLNMIEINFENETMSYVKGN